MVKSCCMENCKTVWQPRSNYSFHSFPLKNEVMLQKWAQKVPSKVKITKYSCVCSKHFLESDFEKEGFINRLKKSAVPNTFSTDSSELVDVKDNEVSQGVSEPEVIINCLTDSSEPVDVKGNEISQGLSESAGPNQCLTDNSEPVDVNINEVSKISELGEGILEEEPSIKHTLPPIRKVDHLRRKIKNLQSKLRRKEIKLKNIESVVKSFKSMHSFRNTIRRYKKLQKRI